MPSTNRFRHQAYRSERPTSPYHLVPQVFPAEPSSDEFREQLAATGAALSEARVATVYCVHGTFSGNDLLGLTTELARFSPSLSQALARLGKQTVDWIVGETGNYTPQFAAAMQEGLNAGVGRTIPVRLFNWSSQNNHLGRADGAVRLVDELARLAVDLPDKTFSDARPPRVLLWGHSHGGNVLALLTNLLGADRKARDEFFEAARSFYRPWLRRHTDMPVWPRVQQLLDDTQHPLRQLALDMVTFGTPVRYGWDTDGYANLLHFNHHRPPPEAAEHLAPYPLVPWRILCAKDGDFVQQIGIAGTNFLPNPLAVRTLTADWRLDQFLERDLAREWLFTRLSHGVRVPDEGTTLLVDYQGIKGSVHHHLAGHALYTRQKWLPFHCREVVERFYGDIHDDARVV